MTADKNPAFEDLRMFLWKGRVMVLYTYLPLNKLANHLWKYRLGISELDLGAGTLIHQQSLHTIGLAEQEKNWVPIIINSKLHLVSNFAPFLRIVEIWGEIGALQFKETFLAREKTPVWDYGEIRGGTQFISPPFSAKIPWQYSFVHSHINLPNGNNHSRHYFYTIMRINTNTFEIEIYAQPLNFSVQEDHPSLHSPYHLPRKDPTINVVFPMSAVESDDGVILSYGKDDCISQLKYYSWAYLVSLF